MNKLNRLTKEKLINLYMVEKKSLGDIGMMYDVSRTAVYKKLKSYGIKQRSKSEARIEAQKQGKLPQQFFNINENFFGSWSPEMAYVLGLIITDGCISKSGTVSLSMNDKELLEKVRKVMGSEHKIEPSKHQKGLYYFHFTMEKLTEDLHRFGILPRKSLTVKFPDIPGDFLADFIEGLQKSLESLGMPKRTVYRQKTKNGWSHMFIYDYKDSVKLFNILYKNAQNSLFLDRKYRRFLEGLKKGGVFEGGIKNG